MNANTMLALGIMWKGMLGIFVVMGILALYQLHCGKIDLGKLRDHCRGEQQRDEGDFFLL